MMTGKGRPKMRGSSIQPSEATEVLKLKREIGLTSAVSLIAGTMIGSGIFMSPEGVLRNIGSPGGSLIIWTACGLLATFGALSYAELGTLIKESGGEYIYILRNFGSFPAFLYIFTSVIVVRPASVAAISLSFAEYAVAPFYPGCSSSPLAVKCTAIACILLLALVNCLSVKLATSIMNIFTAAKLLALLIIIVGGIQLLIQGHTQSFQNAFQGTKTGAGVIGIAFYQGLWSFDGWSNLNSVTEEVKKPEVNLPRAMMIAIPLVTFFYVLVNVSYFAAMSPVELLSSSGVAITWGDKVLGSWAWLMSLSAALSSFGSANGTFFSGGRVCYIAAREGHMPGILSMAHVRRVTPSPALIFTSIVSFIIVIPGNFSQLVNLFSFTAWFFYGITVTGLLYLKIKKPEMPRSYKVPIIIPVIFLLSSAYLVLAPIIDQPQMEFLYVILFILSGAIFYFPLVRYKYHPACLQRLTLHLQLLLDVVPTEKNMD
ncbi:b(0,+)-type amino acid transporter 1 isoform X1 [Anolis carolinensis]|uniref:b(0,+)-type amino acid transporter 1 n=1 Tax=Anolis carolinensis TaxID=28377 RepID=G1KKD4_ANOCA|nr:PREDICTED: b(0,+)-type amino acid transporter 1 [Anolis carolinensis]|eukprot:XP_003215508.2 PREDICTED: b(0,+)-type amino acid transporter 1 [Anolis carolinensis]